MNMTVLMAQLLEAQQTLLQEQERANLLSAIAQVANLLLRSPNYATVSPAVVKLLGEAVGSDRCCLTQEVTDPTTQKVAVKFVAEYTTRGIPSKFNNPEYQEAGEIDEVPPSDLQSRIGKGESVNFLVSELPDCSWKSLFEAQQCTSLLIVPIMVSGQCWGAIGFDNCRKPRLHDKAEIEILQVAADSIAAAIERQAKDDELRRSEALYRSLFEISNEGIWRWTLDRPISMGLPIEQQVEQLYQHYSVVQANNTFAEMFGFAKGEDVVRWRLINSHLQKSDKNQVMMRTYVENGHHARNLETEEVDSQGCKRYFLNSVISFTENHHIIIGG